MRFRGASVAWLRVLLTLLLGVAVVGGVSPVPAAATTTGKIEVCKTGSGSGVSGDFEFTASGLDGTVKVPVGQCSLPITVPAGEVTVTELARDGYQLDSVTRCPSAGSSPRISPAVPRR